MNPQRNLIELALRMLGNPNRSWMAKMYILHGIEMAAINAYVTTHDLSEITTASRHLYLESDE